MTPGLLARSLGPAQRIIATAALAFAVLGCALHPYIYHDFLVIPYFAVGLGCVLILQLRVLPALRAAIAVVAIGLTLLQIDLRLLGFAPSAMAVLSLFGLSSLLVLGWEAIWKSPKSEMVQRAFLAATALGVCVALTGLYIERSLFWRTKMCDLFLYSFDSSLGTQWTFLLAQYARSHSAAKSAAVLVYDVVLVPPALVYAALLRDLRRARIALWAFLLVAPLAAVCFLLFPATGPVYAFQTFPKLVVPAAEIARLIPMPVEITGPRNALPSLHFAWVLLAFWNSRQTRGWIRAFCAVMVMLTLYATLETGEHYGIDLLVAVPFALAVQAVAVRFAGARDKAVFRILLMSAVMTVAWFVALRWGNRMFWVSVAIPWAAVVATLAGSFYLYRQLTAAQEEPTAPRLELIEHKREQTARAQSVG